jgi:hypothetical protein
MSELDKIGVRFQTDKSSLHHDFLRFYERRLARFRQQEAVIFEFGVHQGASIRTLAEFFPHGKVVGVDINLENIEGLPRNAALVAGDATSLPSLKSLIDGFGWPDIVIDDASHRWDHQIQTLQYVWPFLKPGGVYIVEALDTSFAIYGRTFEGYSQITTFNYIAKLARYVACGGAFGDIEKPFDNFIATEGPNVSTVEFYRRAVLITKREPS